ncbi:uncharacterized protein METZ01_LOCUS206787 [marine metagenome]|uniref:Uncharacterized protein n=1 Tax=marine metagenome TaxID=408172 RepID=A0A382EVE3_9ZZZZ
MKNSSFWTLKRSGEVGVIDWMPIRIPTHR